MQDEYGETALFGAGKKGHLETVILLLHRGAVVNYQSKVRLKLGNLVMWWSATVILKSAN